MTILMQTKPAEGQQIAIANAIQHIAAARYAEAEELLWRVLEADRRRHEALQLLAMLALQFKRFEVAERLAKEALALEPRAGAYYATLGRAQRGQDRHAEAEASFRAALRLNGKLPEVHVLLGLSLKAQGKLAQTGADGTSGAAPAITG